MDKPASEMNPERSFVEPPAPEEMNSQPQKRTRDYGEELKGLSSGDESDSDVELRMANNKRLKKDHEHGIDDGGGGSDSEGLDDGEIVDSPLPSSHPVQPPADVTEPEHHANVQLDTLNSIDHGLGPAVTTSASTPTPVPSADGAQDTSQSGMDEGHGSTDTHDEAATVESFLDPEKHPTALPAADAAHGDSSSVPLSAGSGFNQGVLLGTRTSFGAKNPTSFFRQDLPTGEDVQETQGQSPSSVDNPALVKSEPKAKKERKERVREGDRKIEPVSTFEAAKGIWNFPLKMPLKIKLPAQSSEHAAYWNFILRTFISHLLKANSDNADSLSYKVIRAGWDVLFLRKQGFILGTKKEIFTIRSGAVSYLGTLTPIDVARIISNIRRGVIDQPTPPAVAQPAAQPITQPAPRPAVQSAHANNSEVDEDHISISSSSSEEDNNYTEESPPTPTDELRLQRRYFFSAEDPSQYCLSCSSQKHTTDACPEMSCSLCDDVGHTSFGCPTTQRCEKCRQAGHNAGSCQEKLSLAPDELGGCAFCNAEHQDDDCTEIWRSFKPSEVDIQQVKFLPIFCYTCGESGHYGPECGLQDMGGKVSGRTTWSKANHAQYVNPDSEGVAIAWAEVDPAALTNEDGEFHIRGQAKRKGHTYFVSSDESDEELIHPPISKRQTHGDIRIASNIGGGGHRMNNNQPPLPPGPPPPAGPRDSFHAAPPGTLPPRPQASANGRPPPGGNNSRGGRGGYRGGRGRGKGRWSRASKKAP
ncbi:hypothetical protein GGR57DRAFT_506128 [Xylariaceae sp. FL1272]|nr:hypothetical protein GGR57DRAFT_506128 [Xylariaceae sp. FL1272]